MTDEPSPEDAAFVAFANNAEVAFELRRSLLALPRLQDRLHRLSALCDEACDCERSDEQRLHADRSFWQHLQALAEDLDGLLDGTALLIVVDRLRRIDAFLPAPARYQLAFEPPPVASAHAHPQRRAQRHRKRSSETIELVVRAIGYRLDGHDYTEADDHAGSASGVSPSAVRSARQRARDCVRAAT